MTSCSLTTFALRRYPGVDPLLAEMMYESDRRAAGLGALDAKRRNGRTIMRSKALDPYSGGLSYFLGTELPQRDELPPFDLDEPICTPSAACVTIIRLPAVRLALRLNISRDELRMGQSCRDITAHRLWQARRQLRRERQEQRR